MKVYRVEGPQEQGPYQLRESLDRALSVSMSEAHSGWENPRPALPIDKLDPWTLDPDSEHLHCGCPTLRALVWWFRGYLRQLRRAGYHVAVYEVPRGHVWLGKSGKQLLFDRRQAKRVQVIK